MAGESENKAEDFKTKLQLWGTVMVTIVTFGTIGFNLVSELYSLRNELVVIRERQNNNTEAIAKFTSPGPRFTAQDGDKLRAELDKTTDRIRLLENKIIIIEDRAGRR